MLIVTAVASDLCPNDVDTSFCCCWRPRDDVSGVKEDKCLCRSAAFKSLGSNLPMFLDARLAIAGYCGALETVDFNNLSLHECYEKGGMCLAQAGRQLSWELLYYNTDSL